MWQANRSGRIQLRRVETQLTWESNAGLTIWELQNTHRWFLTMKGFTLAFLLFLFSFSTMYLREGTAAETSEVTQRMEGP